MYIVVMLAAMLAQAVSPGPVGAPEEQVAQKIYQRYSAIQALDAHLSITAKQGYNANTIHLTGHVVLQKADRWRYEVEGSETRPGVASSVRYQMVSDGQYTWREDRSTRRFQKSPTRQKGQVLLPHDPLITLFFSDQWLQKDLSNRRITRLPNRSVDRVACQGIAIQTAGFDTSVRYELYFDAAAQVREIVEERGPYDRVEIVLTRQHLDTALPASSFLYTPPIGFSPGNVVERPYWFQGFFLPK